MPCGLFACKVVLFQEHSLPTRRYPCLLVELRGPAAKVSWVIFCSSRLLGCLEIQNGHTNSLEWNELPRVVSFHSNPVEISEDTPRWEESVQARIKPVSRSKLWMWSSCCCLLGVFFHGVASGNGRVEHSPLCHCVVCIQQAVYLCSSLQRYILHILYTTTSSSLV